jgi:hypothetical protein
MRLRARTIGVGAACFAILAGGAAYAAIPGGGGVITGCYSKKNGSLRVIDAEAGAKCDNASVTLTWNQQGPAGPQGPAGAQGPPGPAGTGLSSFVRRTSELQPDSSPRKGLMVQCPQGSIAIGGGATPLPLGADPAPPVALFTNMVTSDATQTPTGWLAEMRETEPYDGNWGLHVEVVCAVLQS